MIAKAVCSIVGLALLANQAVAQTSNWAQKMFVEGVVHDFGNVPRGAQLLHRFQITNIYAVRMEIIKIQSGCGCVTAVASKRVLEPRESTTLDVHMDGRRFSGAKTVTVRVEFGPNHVSTAEVRVIANSRSDIVFNPGELNFGTVPRGQTPAQTIDVEYAGTLSWQIEQIIVPQGFPFNVVPKELYRRPGQVGYQLQVSLKPDAPVGTLKQEITLKTNDPSSPTVPVLVEVSVLPPLTVSPDALALGPVPVGKPLVRRVVVRGTQPFKITGLEGPSAVTLGEAPRDTAATVQTVTLTLIPGEAGPFRHTVTIKTDIPGGETPVVISGTAE